MLENHPRNSLLILVFTAIGMLIRYCFFSVFYILIDRKIKNILAYSQGFNQIVYNILLTLLIIIVFVFYLVYDSFHL